MGSIKKAFDLTGKNALVTGGSRGLGLQIAKALGEQGARVVISSRKAPDLEKAQAHLAGLGIKAEGIAADNSRDEDVKRLTDEAIKKLGRVDILVNNAGATWGAPTEDHPIEAWDKVMNPEHPLAIPDQPTGGEALDDPQQIWPHYQPCFDRGPVRKFGGDADGCLQYEQGRGGQFHAGPGG